jgi:hypothetical protein
LADEEYTPVTIVFKGGERANYAIKLSELERLTAEFFKNSIEGIGRYGVQDDNGQKRQLAFRFYDVLYIG